MVIILVLALFIYFLQKPKKTKKAIANVIAPFWDANEVWLIAADSVLFFCFQLYMHLRLVGFLPLIMIL